MNSMAFTSKLLKAARGSSGSFCRSVFAKSRVTPIIVQRQGLRTSSIMSKEQLDQLQKNEFYSKYADKIAKLQKTSPEDFLARLGAIEESTNKKHEEKEFSLPGQPKKNRSVSPSQKKQKKLEDVMKTDLLDDLNFDEIGKLWTDHYKNKDAVSAVIPAETFEQMNERFKEFNTFLFPLPRDKGYEMVMVQFSGNEAHFTTLINFQAYKENAPECLSMVHYTEMEESKGIVLMAGEYDKNVLSSSEAQCLANQVEVYYCQPSQEKLDILQKFTKEPTLFQHQQLIDQMENISLLTSAQN